MNRYYIDTCIWLNLIKREAKGKKLFWKFVQEFLEQHSNSELIISSVVIRELVTQGIIIENALKEYHPIFVNHTKEDYNLARNIETNSRYSISFLDCAHIAICSRINATLITRDYLLIEEAKKYNVLAIEPEKLLY